MDRPTNPWGMPWLGRSRKARPVWLQRAHRYVILCLAAGVAAAIAGGCVGFSLLGILGGAVTWLGVLALIAMAFIDVGYTLFRFAQIQLSELLLLVILLPLELLEPPSYSPPTRTPDCHSATPSGGPATSSRLLMRSKRIGSTP